MDYGAHRPLIGFEGKECTLDVLLEFTGTAESLGGLGWVGRRWARSWCQASCAGLP